MSYNNYFCSNQKRKIETMSFLDLAKSRYTTKKYNPNKKISDEIISKLKEIARMAPSSINSQPWKFVFVSDENIKKRLAAASYFNEQKINDASHLVVFCAIDNIEIFEKQINENLPERAVSYYNQFLKQKEEREIKSWLHNQVYLSLGFFLSGCASLEIDSTPMEGIDNGKYAEILELGEFLPLFAVALGYRDKEDTNQPSLNAKSRLSLEEVITSI